MYPLLILLLQWRLTVCISSPTLEDNMLPTDEEVIAELINSYRGQPEQEIALNLPTDEEAFNEIKPILQSGNPFYYINGGGHFISSSFPEIDARGFHESVFDDLDDFYPISQRGKKYDSSSLAVSSRGFYGDVFTDGFGNFHPVKRYYKDYEENTRQKRSVPIASAVSKRSRSPAARTSRSPFSKTFRKRPSYCDISGCRPITNGSVRIRKPFANVNVSSSSSTTPNHNATRSVRDKRNASRWKWSATSIQSPELMKPSRIAEVVLSGLREGDIFGNPRNRKQKRVPEIGKSGFHGDVFHNQFGKFDTLKRDPSDFHGDVFHKSFGKFETLRKRDDSAAADVNYRRFYVSKRRPQMNGVNADAFYSNFGNFETLKRTPPEWDDDEAAGQYGKRRSSSMAMLSGDAFHSNFGNFDTMKRTLAGDAFHSNFGRFEPMKRTLAGDAFHSSFGRFEPMKRTLAGDAFHSSFGAFEPMKRRTLAGDAFHTNFGSFDTMKRTLAGDAFHSNFGSFDTMKRTLGGDAFHSQFGRFETMKRVPPYSSSGSTSETADQPSNGKFLKRSIRSHSLTGKFNQLRDRSLTNENVFTTNLTRTNTSSTRSK